jgi:hypothetical protein
MKHEVLPFATSLEATQYALEQIHRTVEKLVASNNAQGRELKAAQIQLNLQEMTIKRLRERVERGDGE